MCRHTHLTKLHVGKRLLLSSQVLYPPGQVPKAEENFLFQYSVKHINLNCMTAMIEFNELFIKEGGNIFQCYPTEDGDSSLISDYDLASLPDHHEEFKKYVGRITKKIIEKKANK